MFEQMMIDCSREGSFAKLDNESMAMGLLPSLLEVSRQMQCCTAPFNMGRGVRCLLFMHKTSGIKKNPIGLGRYCR